jgi:hypothetical protein
MTLTILMLAAAIQASPCLPVSGDTIHARDLAEQHDHYLYGVDKE